LAANDPAIKGRKELFQPMSEYVEQATKAPGERRPVHIPSAVTAEEAVKERSGNRPYGPLRGGDRMPHMLPPEDPDSPASPFAPGQPAAGVVADDVPDEQNPAGGPKAADAPRIDPVPPEPQTQVQATAADAPKADAKTAKRK
jgi:hypothetical protein